MLKVASYTSIAKLRFAAVKLKFFIVFISLFLSVNVLSGVSTGKVQSIEVSDSSPAVLFSMSSAIKDTPRCNEKAMFSINVSKINGSAAYEAVLEAKRRGYEITVTGLNTCTNEWKVEDVKNIKLH